MRLAINDLSSDGAQPFHDEDGVIHAVVNGELYDHEKIRASLALEYGVQFVGQSDCEIVVALYKHYGISFLSHLRGEFSLCLFDERTGFFLAARDRYGIKPLFYTISEGRLLVAAEIKAFLPFSWKANWDVKSLREGGWAIDERTIFKGVRKVLPGQYLTVSSFENIEKRQYWDMDYPDKNLLEPRPIEEMIEEVRNRLVDAVNVRLRADVPVGIYLSGGIDSSAVAGITTHLVRERGVRIGNAKESDCVSCFSIAFDADSGFDESPIAARTAEHLGVTSYILHMAESDLAKHFEDATWHCEHHNPDLNYVGKFALSELPRKHGFKVVLTGEGADENFAGYPIYFPDYFREPDLATEADLNPLDEQERKVQAIQSEHATAAYLSAMGAALGDPFSTSVSRRMLNNITTVNTMAAFNPANLYVSDSIDGSYPPTSMEQTIANAIDGLARSKMVTRWHPLHTALYTWSKGSLANMLLSCLGDRTEMAHSLEARTPFLDHHLTEYVNGLPPSVKVRWSTDERKLMEKWILREAVKPFVTEEIYNRTKHPYTAPVLYPRDGSLHKLLKRLITQENVTKLGFLEWSKISVLLGVAFDDGEEVESSVRSRSVRHAIVIAQWIVIAQKFGMYNAEII